MIVRSKTTLFTLGLAVSSVMSLMASAPATSDRAKIERLPKDLEERVFQRMGKDARQNKLNARRLGVKNPEEMQPRGLFSSKAHYFQNQPHFLREVSSTGALVTIENGAAWTVAEKDQYIVQNWSERAQVAFRPNSRSLWEYLTGKPAQYKYRIVNLETGKSVRANLELGPFVNNPHTGRIRKINKEKCEVVFQDGTLWKCDRSKASRALLKEWQNGDFIIQGENSTWFGIGFPHIIINVSSDNWIPAERLI